MKKYTYFFIAILILTSCQEGLAPIEKAIIQGTIHFKGEFPPDSLLKDIRVVAFQKYPPQDIVSEVLNGRAIFTGSLLPIKNNQSNYRIEIENYPLVIEYFVVARQYGTLFDWDVIGIYSKDTIDYKPEKITISRASVYNIDFEVNFNKKLPQPF